MTEDRTDRMDGAEDLRAESRRQQSQGRAGRADPRGRSRPFPSTTTKRSSSTTRALRAHGEAHRSGEGFWPEEIDRLLDVSKLETEEVEVGWCNLPNGAGLHRQQDLLSGCHGRHDRLVFAWHPLEDLRIASGTAAARGIMLSPIDRARSRPEGANREKNWGVTHYVTENCDCGFENIDITFRSRPTWAST